MTTKRRKRTSSTVPAKGRMRDICDALWSLAVRTAWGWKCAICGRGNVEAHHLIPRGHTALRHVLKNGMALCSGCHQFCRNVSPHQNAAGFVSWLELHHPELAAWVFDNRRPQFDATVNVAYYCDVIRSLEPHVNGEDFVRIVGKKFSKWLTENA